MSASQHLGAWLLLPAILAFAAPVTAVAVAVLIARRRRRTAGQPEEPARPAVAPLVLESLMWRAHVVPPPPPPARPLPGPGRKAIGS